MPTHSLELIWKNYEAFEQALAQAAGSGGLAAKQLSTRVIAEQRPRFQAARMAYRWAGVLGAVKCCVQADMHACLCLSGALFSPSLTLSCSFISSSSLGSHQRHMQFAMIQHSTSKLFNQSCLYCFLDLLGLLHDCLKCSPG